MEGAISKGLDADCAAGRFSFEVTRKCNLVIGMDRSEGFVYTAPGIFHRQETLFSGKRGVPHPFEIILNLSAACKSERNVNRRDNPCRISISLPIS
jgi:hypothetical protein